MGLRRDFTSRPALNSGLDCLLICVASAFSVRGRTIAAFAGPAGERSLGAGVEDVLAPPDDGPAG